MPRLFNYFYPYPHPHELSPYYSPPYLFLLLSVRKKRLGWYIQDRLKRFGLNNDGIAGPSIVILLFNFTKLQYQKLDMSTFILLHPRIKNYNSSRSSIHNHLIFQKPNRKNNIQALSKKHSPLLIPNQKIRHRLILNKLIPIFLHPRRIRRALKIHEPRPLALLQRRVVHHAVPRAVGPSVQYGHFVRVVVFDELFERFVAFDVCAESRSSGC